MLDPIDIERTFEFGAISLSHIQFIVTIQFRIIVVHTSSTYKNSIVMQVIFEPVVIEDSD